MQAPEKIYGWLNTQLSTARHYGGCHYNSQPYVIDMDDPKYPLVRRDVYFAELDAKKKEAKKKRAEAKKAEKPMETGNLWND